MVLVKLCCTVIKVTGLGIKPANNLSTLPTEPFEMATVLRRINISQYRDWSTGWTTGVRFHVWKWKTFLLFESVQPWSEDRHPIQRGWFHRRQGPSLETDHIYPFSTEARVCGVTARVSPRQGQLYS